MLVASRPGLMSSGAGPVRRNLRDGALPGRRTRRRAQRGDAGRVRGRAVGGRQHLDAEARVALEAFWAAAIHIANTRDGALGVHALLRDVYGQPALLVHAHIERAIFKTGRQALLLAVGGIVAAGLVVLAVTVALLQRLLVGPISRLTGHLLDVGSSGDLSRRVGLEPADEIGILGRQFDDMLEKLADARRQLLEQSYSAGLAEMASGVLHNIRNQLAPLSLRRQPARNIARQTVSDSSPAPSRS